MKSYIFTIITISVIGGIISSLINEENSGIKKRLNFVIGLICTIVLLSPIVSIVNNTTAIKNSINDIVDEFNIDNSSANKLIISQGTEKIAQGIKEAVADKFRINKDEIKVDLKLNTENIEAIKIEQIIINLIGKSTWRDEYDIKKFVEEQTGCSAKIKKQ